MANNREKHAIAAAALAVGTMSLFQYDKQPPTVQKMIDTIRTRGNAAIEALPDLSEKEARSVSRRIENLGAMLEREQVNGISITSLLLAILEVSVDSTHCKELERLFVAVRRFHNYYVRYLLRSGGANCR
jgi:hypothetical protein